LEFLGCQAKTIVMFKLKNAPFIGYSQYKGFTLLLFLEYI
jgi:hypothetical protein